MKSVLSQGPSKYGKNAKYSKTTTKSSKSSKLSSVFSLLLTQPLDKTLEQYDVSVRKGFQRKIKEELRWQLPLEMLIIPPQPLHLHSLTPSLIAVLSPEA